MILALPSALMGGLVVGCGRRGGTLEAPPFSVSCIENLYKTLVEKKRNLVFLKARKLLPLKKEYIYIYMASKEH